MEEKKSSSWKSLFITEDPKKETEEKQTDPVKLNTPASTVPRINNPASSTQDYYVPITQSNTVTTTPVIDEQAKLKAYLENLFEESKNVGLSYYQFRKALIKMESIPDNIKYSTVFSLLETSGTTKETLLSNIESFKTLADKNAAEFENEVNTIYLTEAANNRSLSEIKKNEIIKKEEQIKTLQAEIMQNTQDSMNLLTEADAKERKANEKLNNYKVAYEKFKTSFDNDVDKINTYIN